MTKSEILASDLPPVEKVWLIASQRSDIGADDYGICEAPEGFYERAGRTCCPIGAVLDGLPIAPRPAASWCAAAGDALGVDRDWVYAFTIGLDGSAASAFDIDAAYWSPGRGGTVPQSGIAGYAAGQELRRRFIERGVDLG